MQPAASACVEDAAAPPSPGGAGTEATPPDRYQRILNWWNEKSPLDELPPYDRHLALREIKRLAQDPTFEPPPPGWKPPTLDELLEKMNIKPHD